MLTQAELSGEHTLLVKGLLVIACFHLKRLWSCFIPVQANVISSAPVIPVSELLLSVAQEKCKLCKKEDQRGGTDYKLFLLKLFLLCVLTGAANFGIEPSML